MATKSALVLGICDYDDQKLAKLKCPESDVSALADVLGDTGLGGFDKVDRLVDGAKAASEKAISKLFSNKQYDDLVVFYFSGHGLRDDQGQLYLALKDTDCSDLDSTAIAADWIKRIMDKSNSRRQVLILDCCHSGAFSSGFKAESIGSSVGTKSAFSTEGFGRVILTASDATQYAWEGETVRGEGQTSLYTSFLIEGLKSGEADISEDGEISVDELHAYVSKRTSESKSKQTPTKIGDREKGSIILCAAPRFASSVPPEIEAALKSPSASIRAAIVPALAQLFLSASTPADALSAFKALAALKGDDSLTVQRAASTAIESLTNRRADLQQTMLDDMAAAADKHIQDAASLEMHAREQERVRTRQTETVTPKPLEIVTPPPVIRDVPIVTPPVVLDPFRNLKKIAKIVAWSVGGLLVFLILIGVVEGIYQGITESARTTTTGGAQIVDGSTSQPQSPTQPTKTHTPGNSNSSNQSLAADRACVYDPISNLRSSPTVKGDIVCVVNTVKTIQITGAPVQNGEGTWWPTNVCVEQSDYPGVAYIAANQIHLGQSCPQGGAKY